MGCFGNLRGDGENLSVNDRFAVLTLVPTAYAQNIVHKDDMVEGRAVVWCLPHGLNHVTKDLASWPVRLDREEQVALCVSA